METQPTQEEKDVFSREMTLTKGHRGFLARKAIERRASLHAEDLADQKTGRSNPLIENAKDARDLAERLLLAEKKKDLTDEDFTTEQIHSVARALGKPSAEKWVELIDGVFASELPKETFAKIFSETGCVPEELFTKKKFRSLSPESLVQCLAALREMENGEYSEIARAERAHLINHLFIGGHLNKLKRSERPVTLDTNGLFVNMGDIHEHLPYGLVDDRTLSVLRDQNWLPESAIDETEIRLADENIQTDQVRKLEASERQVENFLRHFSLASPDEMIKKIENESETTAHEIIKERLIIPDGIIEAGLRMGPRGAHSIMSLADRVSKLLSEESTEYRHGLFSSYALMRETEKAYEARTKLLGNPDYYNAQKIARFVLLSLPETDPKEEFASLYGRYKIGRSGDQHSFLETLYHGDQAHVLLNESKDLGPKGKVKLEKIPIFNREQYDELEDALRSFQYFSETVSALSASLEKGEITANTIIASETIASFILSNVTTKWDETSETLDRIYNGDTIAIKTMLDIGVTSKKIYSDFLYRSIGKQISFLERFTPEVEKRDIFMDQKFRNACEGIPSYAFEESFFNDTDESDDPLRVCFIHHKTEDPSETIPYHVEETAVDMLRLDRNRPLINIVGGCKNLDLPDGNDPLALMSEAVLSIGHTFHANIAIPGTQSGIGVTFGLANKKYLRDFSHLSHHEKAHVFAVSPGGSTIIPDNPYIEATEPEHRYAMTYADSILTPFPAEWEKHGMDRLHSKYYSHVAYMEAIYKRISSGQPKALVAGNGGLFSIAEIKSALEYGFEAFFISDSGRFASAAAILINHLDRIQSDDPTEATKEIREILSHEMAQDIFEEFCKKDLGFGREDDNKDAKPFQIKLFEFIQTMRRHKKALHAVTLEDLHEDLHEFFSSSASTK